MNAKPKPTLRRAREYTETLARAYRDRAATAAERGDADAEHTYREVLRVLTMVIGVMG